MSTAKRLMHDEKAVGYFEELSASTQEIIKEAILKAAEDRNGPECWKSDEDSLGEIECRRRDGFIPFDHNRGGLVYQNFTDLNGYWGGGYTPAHDGAAKEIERQIDYSFKLLREDTFNTFKNALAERGLTEKDCEYHTMNELEEKYPSDDLYTEVRQYIENGENEYLGGESTIMHEIRIMYHGKLNGLHSASLSAAVNTEGPYHRSGGRNEGSKEVEITWRNNAELKRKLAKTLAKVSKEVF